MRSFNYDNRIIDAHAHIYEILKGYGAKGEFRPLGGGRGLWATGKVEQFFPAEYGDTGFYAETLIKLMDEAGVDRAVLLQGGNYGFHNDYMAEAAAKYPDRLTAVGAIDPYALYAEDIFDNLVSRYNFTALKFEISSEWGLSGFHRELKLTDEFVIFIMARYTKSKGLPFLLDSIKKLKEKTDIPFKLVIAGDGEDKELIGEKIKALECKNYEV